MFGFLTIQTRVFSFRYSAIACYRCLKLWLPSYLCYLEFFSTNVFFVFPKHEFSGLKKFSWEWDGMGMENQFPRHLCKKRSCSDFSRISRRFFTIFFDRVFFLQTRKISSRRN